MDSRLRRPLTDETPIRRVGEVAPGFELRRSFDESVRLDELTDRGPVLLLFYVFDFGDI